jgi:hypothetical protein
MLVVNQPDCKLDKIGISLQFDVARDGNFQSHLHIAIDIVVSNNNVDDKSLGEESFCAGFLENQLHHDNMIY